MQHVPMPPLHWKFVEELREYSSPHVRWQAARSVEVPDLRTTFPDPQGVLDTAYEPVSWAPDSEVLQNFPKLGGAKIFGQAQLDILRPLQHGASWHVREHQK